MKNKLVKIIALISLLATVALMAASCVTGGTYAEEAGKGKLTVSSKEEVVDVPYTGAPKIKVVQEYRD